MTVYDIRKCVILDTARKVNDYPPPPPLAETEKTGRERKTRQLDRNLGL